ncbi:hypothetical protein CRE_09458 [Caenorhabditis remanei]|uniref:Acyltransferase 3 domain-containing protein n=1 Tax=Caenorhabditis remanei TaxID=31234 RepID=E3LIY5_CAERE|nr:hypothetical protein CRE_09458 [Caenorhabditis remanei]
MTKSIRQDVQVIRGLAIIAVLTFHFYPNNFPNGFLGVDQFFVISGYLMCMLLKKVESDSWYTILTHFYYRRLKRILPLYFLIILLVLISIHVVLPLSKLDTNIRSAEKSLTFTSNKQESVLAKNYFEKLSQATDLFTHTWSLSVEVQFYLMVPFLFIITRHFSANSQIAVFIILGERFNSFPATPFSAGISSFVFHAFTSRSDLSFNHVFARIWQFTFGMIACLKIMTDNGDGGHGQEKVIFLDTSEGSKKLKWDNNLFKTYSNSILIVTIAITFYSTPINPLMARVTVTILTAVFIYASSNNVPVFNNLLIYTGNISFALYLVHWPLYAYWKIIGNNSHIGLFLTFIISIFISIVFHETFERWSLKLDWKRIILLIALLGSFNILALEKEEIEILIRLQNAQKSTSFEVYNNVLNKTFTNYDQVEIQNRLWQKNDFVQLAIPNIGVWVGRNHRPGLSGNGTLKFMILGSSTMANLAPVIQDECGTKAKEISQVTFPFCEPVFPTQTWHCTKQFGEYLEAVRDEKPDYLFVGGRFNSMGDPLAENITNIDFDPILAVARDQLQEYMKHVSKKIILLHAFPRPVIEEVEKLAQHFREKMTPDEIDASLNFIKLVVDSFENGYNIAKQRYGILLKECGVKCDYINYTKIFHNPKTNTVRYFNDIGLSYFTSGLHLTPIALEIARPGIKELCTKL